VKQKSGKMVLISQDFARRRMDVPNRMFRVAQWTFLFTAITLVLVSYYVHSRRVKPPATTEPAKTEPTTGAG